MSQNREDEMLAAVVVVGCSSVSSCFFLYKVRLKIATDGIPRFLEAMIAASCVSLIIALGSKMCDSDAYYNLIHI